MKNAEMVEKSPNWLELLAFPSRCLHLADFVAPVGKIAGLPGPSPELSIHNHDIIGYAIEDETHLLDADGGEPRAEIPGSRNALAWTLRDVRNLAPRENPVFYAGFRSRPGLPPLEDHLRPRSLAYRGAGPVPPRTE